MLRVCSGCGHYFASFKSFSPNCVRHTLGILAESSAHSQYQPYLLAYYDDIYNSLLNSCMESTTFYAAVCLYNLRPNSDEARVMITKLIIAYFLLRLKLKPLSSIRKKRLESAKGKSRRYGQSAQWIIQSSQWSKWLRLKLSLTID